jgi:hypothetical protein
MAKKTVARRQGATRRTAPATQAKAPVAAAKLPPGGGLPARAARGTKKAASSPPASPTVEPSKPATKSSRAAAKRAFVEGLVERGEVAESGAPLGTGMTHEIVGRKRSGTPTVARRRFSLR